MFKPKASGPGMNITLSDAGGTSIQSETSGWVLTGTYSAEGSLADFTGLAADGDKSSSTWVVSGAGLDPQSHGGQQEFVIRGANAVTFYNMGTLRKRAGTDTEFQLYLNNTGLVDVRSGTFNVNDGGNGCGQFEVESGAALDFANSYEANTGAIFSGTGSIVLSGGTFTADGNITLANNITLTGVSWSGNNANITGVIDWTSGSLSGQNTITGTLNWYGGTLDAGATLTVATNGLLVLAGRKSGPFRNWSASSNLRLRPSTGGHLRVRI